MSERPPTPRCKATHKNLQCVLFAGHTRETHTYRGVIKGHWAWIVTKERDRP